MFSLLDNEQPSFSGGVTVLPGGYPELFASRLVGAAKFGVSVRQPKTVVYAECGGCVCVSQRLVESFECWPVFGALELISCWLALKLMVYKYCVLGIGRTNVFVGHEHRYFGELSKANQNHLYLVRAGLCLRLEGFGLYNTFSGYTHFAELAF
ncbi:hypothetical protein AAHH88_00335 [Candidatus Hodgkinia cicadicola]